MPSARATRSPSSRWSERALETAQFGTVFSDHILVANYENGQWGEPEIVPYGPLPLPPAPSALHYGQAVFEGFRAHWIANGRHSVKAERSTFALSTSQLMRRCRCDLRRTTVW
jgi:branched-chain amino acid aminotransferase